MPIFEYWRHSVRAPAIPYVNLVVYVPL